MCTRTTWNTYWECRPVRPMLLTNTRLNCCGSSTSSSVSGTWMSCFRQRLLSSGPEKLSNCVCLSTICAYGLPECTCASIPWPCGLPSLLQHSWHFLPLLVLLGCLCCLCACLEVTHKLYLKGIADQTVYIEHVPHLGMFDHPISKPCNVAKHLKHGGRGLHLERNGGWVRACKYKCVRSGLWEQWNFIWVVGWGQGSAGHHIQNTMAIMTNSDANGPQGLGWQMTELAQDWCSQVWSISLGYKRMVRERACKHDGSTYNTCWVWVRVHA